MQVSYSGEAAQSGVVLLGTWLFNYIAMITRDDISFFSGLIVSILAGIYYIIMIKKNGSNRK